MRSNWWRQSRGTQSLICDRLMESVWSFGLSKWSSPSFILVPAATVWSVSWATKSFSSGIIIHIHALHTPLNIVKMGFIWNESLDPTASRLWHGIKRKSPLPVYSSPPCWTPASTCGAFDLEAHSRSSTSHFLMDEIIDGSLHLF